MLIWIGHAPPLRVDSNPNLITNYTVGGWLDQSSQPRPIWLPLMLSTFHVPCLPGFEDTVCVCEWMCVCESIFLIKSLFSTLSEEQMKMFSPLLLLETKLKDLTWGRCYLMIWKQSCFVLIRIPIVISVWKMKMNPFMKELNEDNYCCHSVIQI